MTENLSLDQFNPTVTELTVLADKYKSLIISGPDDKDGYEAVKSARIELVHTRTDLAKKGKLLRDEANKFSKAVIEKEKELIAIIEPTEKELAEKQKVIDDLRLAQARMQVLPDRQAKLKEIDIDTPDADLLLMDNAQFDNFYNLKHAEVLRLKQEEQENARLEAERIFNEKQAKLVADQKKVEDDRIALETEKRHQAEMEVARKEAAERATKEAEAKAALAIKEAEAKAIREKQEAEERHQKQLEEDARLQKEQAEKIKKEQENLEKKKKYQAFLAKYEYDESGNFQITKTDKSVTLWKKLGEFII